MECEVCNRELPNKDFITTNGCIWCDEQYHQKDINEREKL